MAENLAETPRWGNQARDRKALAIWHTLLECNGPGIAEGAWLDVGCGSGGIAATLANKARLVTGIDPEPWSAWAREMDAHSNLRLVTGRFDGDSSTIPAFSIDVVVCNQVYEHVDDPLALLRNIHRVLVPGGICYFAGPNLLWPVEPHVFWPFVHWLPRKFAQLIMRSLGSRHASDLDAWSWSYWRLTHAFRTAGFSFTSAIRERIHAHAQISHSNLARVAAHIPRRVIAALSPVAPGFVFVLTKQQLQASAGE